jgi:PAS domain S-box-containing protein
MVHPATTHEAELERFRTTVEVAGEPIYTLNEAGRFTFVNDALLEATGYSRAELLGEDVSMLLSDAAIQRCEDAIADLSEMGDRSRPVELQVGTTAGEQRQAEVTLALLPADVGGTVGVARAID